MTVEIAIGGKLRRVALELTADGENFQCTVDGEALAGSLRLLQPGVLSLVLGDRSYRCLLDHGGEQTFISIDGQRYAFTIEDPRSLKKRRERAGGDSGPRSIKASMPGRVVRLLTEQGAEIEAQQGVLVIEAMKMQNELKSPKAGRVAELRVAAGDTVNAGDVLAVIE